MNLSWPYLLLLLAATLVMMEVAVTLFHKYVMHGMGWTWHESHHHPPRERGWERNDWFAVVFTAATVVLFVSVPPLGTLWWVAFGVSLYGLLYALLHDVATHRRLAIRWEPKHPYLRRLITAHRLHHAARTRENAISFGFLYAPPVERLQQQLRKKQGKK